MMLLNAIKKIVYTGRSDNLHTKHNKAMAHISNMMSCVLFKMRLPFLKMDSQSTVDVSPRKNC